VHSLSAVSRPILLIGVLIAIAILRGQAEFGAAASINGARGFVYVFVGVAFARVCLPGRWRSIELVWFATAGVLVVLAVLFIAQGGLGTYAESGDRPLNSGQALIVAQASVLALTTTRPGHWRLVSVAGFFIVVLSQQRTVWIATLAMALVLAHQAARRDVTSGRAVRLGLGATLTGLVALVALSPPELQRSLTAATSNISADKGTFGYRIQGWEYFIEEFGERNLGEQLVGQASGTTLVRIVGGIERTESAHNMYLQILVSIGLVGLIALVLVYVAAIRRSWRSQPELASIIVGLCVFSMGYQLEVAQGIWLGFALSLSATCVVQETRVRAPQTA
jgi:hypothetical protein